MTIPLKGITSYAYLPQANGMIEIFDRTRKAYLNARHTGSNWVEELHWVLLRLTTAQYEDLGYYSAEMVYDELLTIPGEMFSKRPIQDFLP